MEKVTPNEVKCNDCNETFELITLSKRTSKMSKTVFCPYCENIVGLINTPNMIKTKKIKSK